MPLLKNWKYLSRNMERKRDEERKRVREIERWFVEHRVITVANIFHCQVKNYHVEEEHDTCFCRKATRKQAHSFSFFLKKNSRIFYFLLSSTLFYHFLIFLRLSLSHQSHWLFSVRNSRGQFSTQSPPFRMQFAHSNKFFIVLLILNYYLINS